VTAHEWRLEIPGSKWASNVYKCRRCGSTLNSYYKVKNILIGDFSDADLSVDCDDMVIRTVLET